ncbi:MAG: MerR family transcriptional regulator [Luteitalea sp.]|nr:MerR family transcriptional regulator [Luteitalea sp.]
MATLSIGQVAGRAGIRPSALRFYEQTGLLPPGPRVSGQRRYDQSVFDKLALIAYAKRVGFTLRETKLLLSGFSNDVPPSARWRGLANRKRAELDALIADVRRMKHLLDVALHCECPTLDECGRRLRSLQSESGMTRARSKLGARANRVMTTRGTRSRPT